MPMYTSNINATTEQLERIAKVAKLFGLVVKMNHYDDTAFITTEPDGYLPSAGRQWMSREEIYELDAALGADPSESIPDGYDGDEVAWCWSYVTRFIPHEVITVTEWEVDDYNGRLRHCAKTAYVDNGRGMTTLHHIDMLAGMTRALETQHGISRRTQTARGMQ